jgi:hypothetical protein
VNTGAENTAVGLCALASNTTSGNNTATGSCALRLNTTGTRNVAFGAFALEQGVTTNDNVGIGTEALRRNATGCCNIAIGTTSLVFNTNGIGNIAIGLDALRPNVTGSFNVGVGTQSFFSSSAGDYNVGVGALSHGLLTTGTRNVAIGPNVNVTLPAGNCQLAIGFANAQNWLTGDSSKNIRPGAGIRDCAGNLGTAGQVLSSTGTALQWTSASGTVSGIVNAGVAICMDNIKIAMAPSGNRSLQVGVVSGTAPVVMQTAYCQNTTFETGKYGYTLTTALININNWNFNSHGAVQSATVCYGNPATAAYCVSMIVGLGYNENVLCITRIV